MQLNAKWTDDCQGKKDFDGEILVVSTRYWPRGGGYDLLTRIAIRDGYDLINLVEKEFRGETFEEVAGQVERWAHQQMQRAVAALENEY